MYRRFNLVKNENNDNFESTISHEHLHLVQYEFEGYYNYNNNYTDIDISRLKIHAELDFDSEDNLNYLMNKYELEVRIHRIISYLYLKKSLFPNNLNDFSVFMSKIIDVNLNSVDKSVTNDMIDLKHILYSIDDMHTNTTIENIRLRLINELFAMCYANLIEYYGDTVAANNFRCQIMGPNMYNLTYRCPN